MLPISTTYRNTHISWVTHGLSFFCVIVFLISTLLFSLDGFVIRWGFVPSALKFTQLTSYLPIITSIFLHSNFLHLFFNLWYLNIFGRAIEEDMQKIYYLLFFLTGGIAANLLQYIFYPESTLPIIGASGAISAILGFYWIKYPHHTVKILIPSGGAQTSDTSVQTALLFWFGTQLTNALIHTASDNWQLGGIAWWAHIGGFIWGIVMSKLIRSK